MKLDHSDINDDEIRIISSKRALSPVTIKTNENYGDGEDRKSKGRWTLLACAIAAALVVVALIVYMIFFRGAKEDAELAIVTTPAVAEDTVVTAVANDIVIDKPIVTKGHVERQDTIVGRVALSIFTPVDLEPTLQIGAEVLRDSTARFVVQAADVRGDNGGIVGAYVKEGELLSKGQAKSGFCAIIGGNITVGVADATPFLEQAIETNGYFFRQYPLVVANQVVENKPKGVALRKALAEWNGKAVVVMSKEKMTFHNFAQSLVDLGVSNAIYLVGGEAYGFAMDADGAKTEFGHYLDGAYPNINYIVWR